jgi:hypothetical protein
MSNIEQAVMQFDIKGTAMNKGRARVWVERDLSSFGLARHTPIRIELNSDHIAIVADTNGPRKMAGRTKPNGVELSIVDCCFPDAQRTAMFNGAERLTVTVTHGRIIVRAKS